MDYTFGFDKAELAKYGAKSVVFDVIKRDFKDIPIHPYVKVSPVADPAQAQTEACKASNANYFVVRASSRYEFLPGTAGMTNSERFVHFSQIRETIQAMRQPTEAYRAFTRENGLEPENTMPVVVQPMWAASFGTVTEHPNQHMTMVDYFKANDTKERFGERVSFYNDERLAELKRNVAQLCRATSRLEFRGGDKLYARYGKDGFIKGMTSDNHNDHKHLMDLSYQLFEHLDIFGDYAKQGEFGPNRTTTEPVLYQLRPFMPRISADFRLDKNQSDMTFGICKDLELPVVRIRNAFEVRTDDFDTLDCDSDHKASLKRLFEMNFGTMRQFELARLYQTITAMSARRQHNGGVCLVMPSYSYDDGLDFLRILKPRAVVIDDDMCAGMIHNRTNLVQSAPVAIFGNLLYDQDATRVRISCDGSKATVVKIE